MAKRQAEIPGTERVVDKDVEVCAEVYVKSRNKRIKASEAEVADKTALIEAMRKAKLTVYKDEDHGLVITITPGKPNVKVTEDEPANDDEEAEAA